MEECYSGSKRKKRKTRKCLNEIRKKSRMNTNSASVTKNIELGTKINNNVAKVVGFNCNNNYITSNRLTLAIFPKAVRSETITRPVLAEIRHEPGNININNIVVKSKSSVHSENTNNAYEEVENGNSFNLSKNGINMFSANESDGAADNNGIDADIFRLKNSSDVGRGAGSSSGERSAAASPASPARAASPPSSAGLVARLRDHHAYRMYEQFVKNIPTFIEIHAPSLLTGDAMKKPKATLHSMYVEGRRRLAEGERPPPPDAPPRPRRARSPHPEPRSPPESPEPPEPPPRCDTPIRDTPEYTYFPHKLNQ